MVAAFEPNKANFERLNKNIEGNPELALCIKIFNTAVSDVTSTLTFTTQDDIESGRSMGGFLEEAETYWNRAMYSRKRFSEAQTEALPVDSLPDRFGIPSPDIMKIDVEGAEYQVLKGARRTLLENKPILFIEVHSIHSMFDVVSFLSSVSYSAEIINKEPSGICYIEARPQHAHPL
jgi:FkbM family methyltransferase